MTFPITGAEEHGDVRYPYLTVYTVMAVLKTARKKTNHQREGWRLISRSRQASGPSTQKTIGLSMKPTTATGMRLRAMIVSHTYCTSSC